jgi:UDP-N-acetylmuramate--alanine ligase
MNQQQINLINIKSIHFTGIKGVGMASLACCAKDLGIEVSGSDVKEYFVTDETLKQANINWQKGFSPDHLRKPDLLIYTAAHNGEQNPEVIAAKKQNILVLSHGEALGMFMKPKLGISVCGVGGKSTTAAIISTILSISNIHPSYAVGAGMINPIGLPGKFDKKGKDFIAEADEYITSPQNKIPRFMHQKPHIIVLTNLEFDHPDVYDSLDETIKAFKSFINKLPSNGLLIACLDNKNVEKLLKDIKVPYITYGQDKKADFQIANYFRGKEYNYFNLLNKKNNYQFQIQIPGIFNVKNSSAAIITALNLGLKYEKIKTSLIKFQGVKRRFEKVGQTKNIKFYDDYAHHPEEIKATLRAAKKQFFPGRIIAVFQPHTYSRTKALFSQFCHSFKQADKIYITPIYASAREKKDVSVSSEKLVKGLKNCQAKAKFIGSKNMLINEFKTELKANDVVFTLGAGDIFTWNKDIINSLTKSDKLQ